MQHPRFGLILSNLADQKEVSLPHDRSKCPLHVSPSNAWLDEKDGSRELFSILS